MYTVIGTKNCSRCLMVKKFLDSKETTYDYKEIDQYDDFSREQLLKRAEEANLAGYPVIIDQENKILDFQDIFKK